LGVQNVNYLVLLRQGTQKSNKKINGPEPHGRGRQKGKAQRKVKRCTACLQETKRKKDS
jgi:hypothetical protein